MLTGKMVRVRFSRDRLVPVYLDVKDMRWLELAEELLQIYRSADQATRGELEGELREAFDALPNQLVYQGLAKLLEDRCQFEVVSGHPPDELRELVFGAAAERRKKAPRMTKKDAEDIPERREENIPSPDALSSVVGVFDREAILQEVADQLELDKEAVDKGLFADLKSEQRLVQFEDITPERLLERYNVALAQAVLLRSTGVEVIVRGEPPQRFRQLFRLVKFHRLVCEVEAVDADAYRLRLDGPLSLFTATQKYGLQLALFLPALLRCRAFEVQADLLWGPQRQPKKFQLTSQDGLVSHHAEVGMYVPPELTMFAELFRKKIVDWELRAEADIVPLGSSFWVPDFSLVHRATGQLVYLEVLGFWRRSSAEKHLARLRQHLREPFLLAVSEQLKVDDADLEGLPAGIHRFRQMPLPDEIARLAAEVLGRTGEKGR